MAYSLVPYPPCFLAMLAICSFAKHPQDFVTPHVKLFALTVVVFPHSHTQFHITVLYPLLPTMSLALDKTVSLPKTSPVKSRAILIPPLIFDKHNKRRYPCTDQMISLCFHKDQTISSPIAGCPPLSLPIACKELSRWTFSYSELRCWLPIQIAFRIWPCAILPFLSAFATITIEAIAPALWYSKLYGFPAIQWVSLRTHCCEREQL